MTASAAWAIDMDGVSFAWPREPTLLRITAFKVKRGQRVFLQGSSGSGKSTLLGLIGGVLQPTAGSLRVLGHSMQGVSGSDRDAFRAAHIGFIFQMFNLLPYLSMVDNVLLAAQFSKERAARVGGDLRGEAARLLAALGLGDARMRERPVTTLSVGQQQRVAAARALFGKPELIIADEPTSALDEETRLQFLELLKRECAETNSTLLFVSHDKTLAGAFDRHLSMAELNAAPVVAPCPC